MRHIPYFDSLAQGLRENLLALLKVNGKKVDVQPDGSVDLEIRNIDVDVLKDIKDSCNNSEASASQSERNARVWAEGSDPEVQAIKGKHSSKVASAVASAYAEAPFGESVGDHISADGAIINANVTKTSVDSAIGASSAGSVSKVYSQNGGWVDLPVGPSNGANTDLSNLSFLGEGRLAGKADLINGKVPSSQLPDIAVGADIDLSNLSAAGNSRLLRHRWVKPGEFLSANTIHQVIYPGWVITDNQGAIRFRPNDMIGMSRYGTQVDAIEITEGTLVDGERLGTFYLEHTESAPNGFRINVGGAEFDGALDKVIIVKGDEPGLWYVVEAQFKTERRANIDLSNLTPEGEARFNAKADTTALTALSETVASNKQDVDASITGLNTGKADRAVAAQELAGASVTLQPGRYYTWAASGACAVSYGAWDASRLEVSELRMSVASGATVSFPEGTVLKGDAIEGGKSYIVSVSHDATGYVAVVMERA